MIAQAQHWLDDSPGSQESGLRRFWDRTRRARRTPTAFAAGLLRPVELERVQRLLCGPQWPVEADRRLMGLGLARIVLGKAVATGPAWEALWRKRYEVRRGNDVRRLAVVATIEADNPQDALATAWGMARRDVGPRWFCRLIQEGGDGHWTIFLPPPRLAWRVRPYVLELHAQQPQRRPL